MTEQTTATEAAPTTTSAATPPMSGIAAATADALYGNQQQADGKQAQAAADARPTAESAKAGEADGNAKGATNGAPEKYEFKSPEGSSLDADVLGEFSNVARELNLSQEAAQSVLDRMAPKMAQRQMAQIEAVHAQWTEASRTDKEFGGDKLDASLTVAKRALDSFGTPQLRSLLNESGLGNHPEVIRFMVRAGQSISEDRFVAPSQGSSAKGGTKDWNSAAAALYTNQT